MIRVREILMRHADGRSIQATVRIDYDVRSISAKLVGADGIKLPCGSFKKGTVNMPGGLRRGADDHRLDAAARDDANDLIAEGRKGGFKVASDATIDYPDGTEPPA